MLRPRRRDLASLVFALPASTVLVLCLFLPQVEECNHHVKTPFETNTAPMMIALAVFGLLPLVWRWRPIRRPTTYVVGGTTAVVLVASTFGIPIAVYLAVTRRHRTDEELVALCCMSAVSLFILMFPLVGLFARWEVGGTLTWVAACVEWIAMLLWASAANARPIADVS